MASLQERAGPHAESVVPQLVATLLANGGFYQRKLVAAGCARVPTSLRDFAGGFPLTTKAELVADQASSPPYGTNLTRPIEDYRRCHQTSGTTGAPLRWLDTATDWSALTDDWVTVLRAAGVVPSDRVFVAFSFGPFLGFWLAFEAAQRLGCLTLPGGGMSSALRARVLIQNECTVLCGTPTYLLHLASLIREEDPTFTRCRVRTLIVAGEPGGSSPIFRRRISEAWHGARIFDHHGLTEVGPVTYEHPCQPGTLVVMERSFFAEILEIHSAAPVRDGVMGELVLTTLRRPGSPLLRYRTGDLVCARRVPSTGTSEAAPTALVLEGGILGRVDDMVIIRGVNVFPSAVDEVVRRYPALAEYRVTVDQRFALPELSLEVEGTDLLAAELERALHEALGLRVPVRSVERDSLPRFELKAKRWRRLE